MESRRCTAAFGASHCILLLHRLCHDATLRSRWFMGFNGRFLRLGAVLGLQHFICDAGRARMITGIPR
jgi:hypothetical protein